MDSCRIRIDSINLSALLSEDEFKFVPLVKFYKGNITYDNNTLTLYVFKSGKAKAIIYEKNEEFILYYLRNGNIIIPEESCAIEFLEDSEVYVIDAERFAIFFKNLKFASAVISSLKERAIMERRIIKNLVFKSCKNRLASFLLEIIEFQNDKLENDLQITLNLSVKEIAIFVGSKRQTVSTMFNELIKKKVLTKEGNNVYTINYINVLQEWSLS
ncbi:MAG: CRP-like cAMP-binding protein [Sulfurimonas sp.]|jgi:CRP-like cAMP-binding protein